VLATANGVVEAATTDSVYGLMLILRHNDSMTTLYGHNDSFLVAVGDTVSAGHRLALSGNSGVSSAPHLHYEVRIDNQPINPLGIEDYEEER
jgi:murein DD-endopeptidase MepM/ murein hydrolase activator NlpD